MCVSTLMWLLGALDLAEPDPQDVRLQHLELVQRQEQKEQHLQRMQLDEVQRQYQTHHHHRKAAHGLAPKRRRQSTVSNAQQPHSAPMQPQIAQTKPALQPPVQSRLPQAITPPQAKSHPHPQPKLELPLHEQLDHPLYVLYKEQHTLDAEVLLHLHPSCFKVSRHK